MRNSTRRWILLVAVAAVCLAVAGGAAWRRAASTSSAGPLGPLSAFALPGGARMRFEGRVVDRLAAGSYTYLEVERGDGRRDWVVTLSSSPGARSSATEVRIVAMGYAEQFVSKRLGRTFDGLYFAVVRPV